MKKYFLLAAICLSTIFQASAWGPMGHDVVAYIAERNISKKTAKKVKAILDNHSMVYYSSWLDVASKTEEYSYTKTWHYRNIDEGKTVETMPLNEDGDVVRAVEQIVAQLKEGGLSAKDEKAALMMLIHLVGDMHCPMHAGRLSDLGGNLRKVSLFGRETNLHSLWDSALPEAAHKWSYKGWGEQLDILDKKSKAAIQQGEPIEWFVKTANHAAEIYAVTPEGAELSYDYVSEFTPLLESQLLKGGLRLAYLLDQIYN